MITTPYISIAAATAYFDLRLNSGAWYTASSADSSGAPDERLQALVSASNIVHNLRITDRSILAVASAPDITVTDVSERVYPDMPEPVRLATAEIALALLEGVDPDFEYQILQMTSQKYANVQSTYDRSFAPEHILAGVPSVIAWRYLTPYLHSVASIRLDRV